MRRFKLNLNSGRRAFTLVEVMIALGLLLIVGVSYVTGTIYNARTAQRVRLDVQANQILNRVIEDLRIVALNNYASIGTATGPAAQYMAPVTTQLQTGDQVAPVTFTTTCRFSGFGTVLSASATTLRASGAPNWRTNEWQGRQVMIKSGVGISQVALITANNADTLTITRGLDGSGGGGWYRNPAPGDVFEIDNGKTVDVTVTWQWRGLQEGPVTRRAFIPAP